MRKNALRAIIVVSVIATLVVILSGCFGHTCQYDVAYEKSATCTTDGERVFECKICFKTYTEVIPASDLLHIMGEESTLSYASCQKDEIFVSYCMYGCGYKKERPNVGTQIGHSYGYWIATDDASMASICERCGDKQVKPIPESTHTLSLLKGDSNSYSETDIFKCSTCEAHFEIDDALSFEIGNSELSGYSVKITSKIPTVDFTIVGLSAIKPNLIVSYNGEFTYETVEDISENATELIIGENISVIRDLFLFERIKRLTIGEDVIRLYDRVIESCAILQEIYMEGDCPEYGEATFFVASRSLDSDNITGIYAPTVYYNDGKKGYEGIRLQGCTLSKIGETLPPVPDMTIFEYSERTAKKAEEYAEYFLAQLEKSERKLHLLPYCSLEKYWEIYVLAHELTKDIPTEKEKARAIANWINSNITYDLEASHYPVEIVFETKRAVCNGYVLLMHDMLSAIGIASAYTHGVSLDEISDSIKVSDVIDDSWLNKFNKGHAWLYVYADNELILCDPTWGQFDIEPEFLSKTRLTTGFYGITVAPDEIDPRHYKEYIMYDKDELTYLVDGRMTQFSGNNKIFNYSMTIVYSYRMYNDGYEYIGENGEKAEISTGYRDAIIEYCNMGYRQRLLFDKAYLTYSYIDVLKGIAFGKLHLDLCDSSLPFLDEFVFDDNGNIYLIISDTELELVGTASNKEKIEVPSRVGERNVVGIGWNAFNKCYASEIVIPNTVRYISSTAFWSCINLTEITIPNSVTELGVSIFMGCISLERINLPSSIEFIGLKNNNESPMPYQMFSELSPDKLKVYYDGTKDDFEKINFYSPWGNDESGYFDKEHYNHILEFVVFK